VSSGAQKQDYYGVLAMSTGAPAGTARLSRRRHARQADLYIQTGGARLQLGRGANRGQAHGDLAHGGPAGRAGRPALAEQLAQRLRPVLRQRPPVALRDLRAL